MSAKERLFEVLKDNKALQAQLEKALLENTDDKVIESLLRGAGVEPEEEMLQVLRQKKALEIIAAHELDLNQLETVSGGIGGNGKCDETADCDARFQLYPKTKYKDRCTMFDCCDEFFYGGD